MLLRELFEAIPVSKAKTFRTYWDPSQYEELFKKYTDDPKAYRIYLPLVKSDEEADYDKNVQASVEKELAKKNYKVDDYITGYAISDDGKRRMKIGKLLDNKLVLQMFSNDPVRQLASKSSDKLLVCISRHPYDIAGMSTDRGWTSCVDLAQEGDPDSNAHYLLHDVAQGTIVAYLIDANDKNIKNPKGRYAIKVFINEDNPADWILVREQRAYGSTTVGFKETVDNWLAEVNGDKAEGLYCINPNVYADSAKTTIHTVGKDKFAVLDMIAANPKKYNVHSKIEYTVRKDGTIDLTANVFGALLRYLNQYNIKINKLTGSYDCSALSLAKFPISTPKFVKGDFVCSDNPGLSSLVNAPIMISGDFHASNTALDEDKVRSQITANEYYLDQEW